MEPRARSQETDSEQERELSDYCCRQWPASVWEREKKSKRERESRSRASEREGGSSQTESAVSCLLLSNRKTLVWRRHRGVFFTPVLHMSFTHSFKQYSPSLDCISVLKTMKLQSLHASLLVCRIPWLGAHTHTAPGQSFFPLPFILIFFFRFPTNQFFGGWFMPDRGKVRYKVNVVDALV